MREETLKKIDALHAEIAALIEAEKKHYDAANPTMSAVWRGVYHAQIDIAAHSPKHRALLVEAVASLRRGTP